MSELVQLTPRSGGPKASRKPDWLRIRYRETPKLHRLFGLVSELELNTVCSSAACPNLPECWSRGTATFMIGGNLCTRRCGFCDVRTGRPESLDPTEPARVAEAIERLGLRFAVLTAVARDDLPDGGAAHFAASLRRIRERSPDCRVEVLIPDLKGCETALRTVLDAEPDVMNHNLETVSRLQRRVRPQGSYARSLGVLSAAARIRPDIPVKTGIMLGLGETEPEVLRALADVRETGCTLITIGQYLRPGAEHLPVARYLEPAEFEAWEVRARALGFRDVASGPLVRSSYRAERLAGAFAARS